MTGSVLVATDWVVIAGYLGLVLAIGIFFARRGSSSTGGYFLAGRSLPWWVAGTSIVATTFSSDTPLQVVSLVRQGGIGENWWWWSMAAGHAAGVFLFAPLWRRSALLTDVEFITTRYEGISARILRIVEGLWQGLLVNGVVLASVTIGMATIVRVMLGIPADAVIEIGGFRLDAATGLVAALAIATLGYSMLSGLYGVAWSDLPQFILAMVGSVVLAITVVTDLGGLDVLIERLDATPWAPANATDLAPSTADGAAMATAIAFFTLNWWARVPGHGALAQRLLATRSPRDGALALAWFTIAHYVLRPWPWIIVALASIVLVPTTFDAAEGAWVAAIPDKDAFPWMIRNHLGPGFRGLLVVAMLGAFMSTVDTHVNLSSAYLLNDVLRPTRRLLRREVEPASGSGDGGGAGEVWKARALAIPVLVLVLLVASGFDDIIKLYKYLGVIAAGTAPALILRWYGWRTTAWSEIAAMAASLLVGNLLVRFGPLAVPAEGSDDLFGPRLLAVTIASAAVWIPATLLSRPASDARLVRFLAAVQPGGPGWRGFARRVGEPEPRGILVPMLWAGLGTGGIWMAIVGIGWLLLGRPTEGLLMVLGAGAIGVPTIRAAARLGAR
ncbi:MAG: sodium:solute symporter family transporter [Planctomycetota bacterium]|jgi:SSS family solute:Na+ symporter